jgi:8-oxo-dGTP diphosphatase
MQKKLFCPYCGLRLIELFHENRNRLFCTHCNDPIYENPIPAACLVVTDDQGLVLLVQRSVEPQRGLWCLPGGFIELGESPESAALRELYEETGLTGQIHKLLGVTTNPSRLYDSVLLVGYWVTAFSGNLIAGDDASDAAYFPPCSLPEIAFESHLKFIRGLTTASS